ncbi:hypothetical protein LX36DRAFT_698247 [Colletotrichum falcatum]|nr:hypothetical protein LX36DRAFT_698247 [Colletotrichum falcatum]
MEESQLELKWSAPFAVRPPSKSAPRDLRGDKILLPQSALEQLLAASPRPPAPSNSSFTSYDAFNPYARHQQPRYQQTDTSQQLPNPLMFRLVNQNNGNVVYAGIREFSADDGEIALAPYLMDALGILSTDFISETSSNQPSDLNSRVTVHANQLPKGTYVRLRPLEAGYDPDDWKSLLERQLRESYTTLTKDTVLSVRGVKGEDFKFLVDKFLPEGEGICVVDTDLEVDIEALNEEQARETMRQIMAKAQPGTANGSSKGTELDVWKPIDGQVLPGEYVDYELPAWDRTRPLVIELFELPVPDAVDLFISPKSTRQRAQPRDFEYTFGNFAPSEDGRKSITIQPTNVELENADRLLVSVHGYPLAGLSEESVPVHFRLRAKAEGGAESHDATVDLNKDEMRPKDEEQCKNCLQWVPKRTLVLHHNFCLRNNILCTRCRRVFKKGSLDWEAHWHLPQEGDPLNPSAETILSGLTAHELADGARTTDCHLCQKIVRMRDMAAHMKHHELDKWCRSGRANLGLESKGTSAQAALPLTKPLVQCIPQIQEPMYFCVDEASQRRRKLAEMLAGEGIQVA